MSKKSKIELEDFLVLVKTDAETVVGHVYDSYRNSFIEFGKKYTKNESLLIDAFQEAMIALYNNAVKGKINTRGSTLKTYLFAIGKYKLINILQSENKYIALPEHDNLQHIEISSEPVEIPEEVAIAYKKLGSTCKQIIELFYYRRYSLESIMHTLNLKNENSVKANKSRCIKQLKNLILQIKDTQ